MSDANPAAALYSLLKLGKSVPSSHSCLETCHIILQTKGDLPILFSRLGSIMKLTLNAQIALERVHGDEHEEQWSYWAGRVNNAFLNQQLVGQWGTFADQIDVHAMGYLKLAAAVLQQASPKIVLDGEKLLLVRAQADALLKKIIESELNPELKDYVLSALGRLLVAIDEYFLNGTAPILREVESTMGHIVVDPAYKDFLKSDPLGSEMVDVLKETAGVVSIKENPQLARSIQQLALMS